MPDILSEGRRLAGSVLPCGILSSRQRSRSRRWAIALCGIAIAVGLTGCVGGPPPTTWLAKVGTDEVYISWVDASGSISGTASIATPSDSSSGQPIAVDRTTITGTEHSGKVVLTFGGGLLGNSFSGTINSDTLVLESSDSSGVGNITFHPASSKDFDMAVAALSKKLTAQRDAAQAAADQTAFESAIASEGNDASAVRQAGAALQAQVDALNKAYATEHHDVGVAASQKCSSTAAATRASNDVSAITTSDLDSAVSALDSAASTLYSDLTTTQQFVDAYGTSAEQSQVPVDAQLESGARDAVTAGQSLSSSMQSNFIADQSTLNGLDPTC